VALEPGTGDLNRHKVIDTATELHFSDGIPGFPGLTKFALTDIDEDVEDPAFQLLQSLEDPEIALVAAHPWLFVPEYAPELAEIDQIELGTQKPEDAVVFCPVTIGDDEGQVYINLLGPFVVNLTSNKGRQIVPADSDWPVRTPVTVEYA
jgi:flagellar assembly factor FliW